MFVIGCERLRFRLDRRLCGLEKSGGWEVYTHGNKWM